jgi:hypothetical protein
MTISPAGAIGGALEREATGTAAALAEGPAESSPAPKFGSHVVAARAGVDLAALLDARAVAERVTVAVGRLAEVGGAGGVLRGGCDDGGGSSITVNVPMAALWPVERTPLTVCSPG